MNALFERFVLGGAGPTVAVKDCIDIAGMPTRAGSRALDEILPAARHADVVQAVLDADWRIIGKANMHELAYGMTGVNGWSGTPVNPQAQERIPGGSSSGSAVAVGSGLADTALGSDTGGSIRLPAACCGVIGLKPTFGRVSRRGAWPRESSLDCVGPFARDMTMLNGLMGVIAPGFDAGAAGTPLADARIAVVETDSDPVIVRALEAALAAAGWPARRLALDGLQRAFEAGLVIINGETWKAFGHLIKTGRVGDDVARRLTLAGATAPADVRRAEAVRIDFAAAVDAALLDADALVLPTLPSLPPRLDEVAAGLPVIRLSSLVRPFNLSGHPALSIPIPIQGSALQAGLQLVGRHGEDERLCALGLHLQRALAGQGLARPGRISR